MRLLYGAQEIADALYEARAECRREPETDLWKSFWDRLTEGQHIPPDPWKEEPNEQTN